jgi:chromosomal replication initiator protein
MNPYIIPGLKRFLMEDAAGGTKYKIIIRMVCEELNVLQRDLIGYRLKGQYAYARHLIFYLMRKHTVMSLTQIGDVYQKDHSTVIHSISTINSLCFSNKAIHDQILRLNQKMVNL